jgi:cold shock CspA family protein
LARVNRQREKPDVKFGMRGLNEGQKVSFDTQEDRRTGKITVGNIQAA